MGFRFPGMAGVVARRRQRLHRLVDLWTGLFRRHDLLTLATAIAMQALVALTALTLLFLALLGALGHQEVWSRHGAPGIRTRVLPLVYAGIDETVQKIFSSSSGGLIVFASVLAVWEVSRAVRACMTALSRIEDKEDKRPWWLRFVVATGIALVLTLFLVAAFLLVAVAREAVHGGWGTPFAVARWVGAATLITIGFGVLARFAPAERRPKKWASAGATLVVVGWIVESVIFRWYVTSLANFKSAAGTLGAIFLLTVYLYVAAIILLVAIELDELLREDLDNDEAGPGIIDLVRGLF